MAHLLLEADARRIPLADGSVHCVVTSVPYLGLRDYGTGRWDGGDPGCPHRTDDASVRKSIASSTLHCPGPNTNRGHRHEPYRVACGRCGARRVDRQLGLERTTEEYLAAMVGVFGEEKRVLRHDGTLWLNCGDAFDDKQLLGMPWRLALALRDDGWYLRMDIIWEKKNPMPESATDRPTKSHEYIFLLAKSARYFYDSEAVREPALNTGNGAGWGRRGDARRDAASRTDLPVVEWDGKPEWAGRNLRSVWNISTEAYPGAHFATYPRKLVSPCIRAGSSARGVCPGCGAPWTRETSVEQVPDSGGGPVSYRQEDANLCTGGDFHMRARTRRVSSTTGWHPTCTCRGRFVRVEDPSPYGRDRWEYVPEGPQLEPIPATILDPFVGSGTTLVVAEALGRDGIGLDLSREYLGLARRRIERPHARTPRSARPDAEILPLFPEESIP